MNNARTADRISTKRGFLVNLALLVFVAILVFNGTFFRIRPAEDIPELDWLVLARLISCGLGLALGIILIIKNNARFGFGLGMLIAFLAATMISALNSAYPTTVIGYSILIAGAGVLMIGLVQSARNLEELEWIERLWFFTVSALVLKDATMSIMSPYVPEDSDIVRLGMGITHANQISLLAAILFWLSFKGGSERKIIWLFRLAMLAIICGAISRISILGFTLGGIVYFFLRTKDVIHKWIFVLACLSGIVLVMLSFSLKQRWAEDVVLYAKRGEKQSVILNVSARTYIWEQVKRQIPDSPLTGHGYGISRLALKPIWPGFQASHCHNEILEALFTTGILGLIPLLFMYIYNLKWITSFRRLERTFSSDLALHAVTVVTMLVVSTMFEARISGKLLPFQPLFFYYLLVLDREKTFLFLKSREDQE